MPLILEAACAEFLKLDRPINAADFRWVEPVATEVMSGTKTGEPVLQ
jgi:hypothetical protein